MKYLLTKGYPVKEIPFTERFEVADKLLDGYQDYGRGELERIQDQISHQRSVITSILKVIPEGALQKIAEDLSFKVKDDSKAKTKGR